MADLIDRQSVVDIAMCYCPDDDGSCSKANVDIRELLDEIENMPAVYRWIPCSERLPEKDTAVLICGCRHIVTAYYDAVKGVFRLTEDDNLYYLQENVTHWMPLPEPPEGGTEL